MPQWIKCLFGQHAYTYDEDMELRICKCGDIDRDYVVYKKLKAQRRAANARNTRHH